MSTTLISGLPSVSAYSSLVFGLIARRKFSGSSGSTNVVSMPSLLQVHVQQRVRAAVERRGRDDVVARAAQGQDRVTSAAWPVAVASAARPPSIAAMRSSNTATVGIRDARVDVAEGLQVEQARRVVGGVEDERGRLVDRHRARAGRRVGDLPGVQAQRLDAELAVSHERRFYRRPGVRYGVVPPCRSLREVERRYSEGGTPTWWRKKRVKLLCAEKPSSAESSEMLALRRRKAARSRSRRTACRDRRAARSRCRAGTGRRSASATGRPGWRARPCSGLCSDSRAAARSRGGCGCPRSASRATAARRRGAREVGLDDRQHELLQHELQPLGGEEAVVHHFDGERLGERADARRHDFATLGERAALAARTLPGSSGAASRRRHGRRARASASRLTCDLAGIEEQDIAAALLHHDGRILAWACTARRAAQLAPAPAGRTAPRTVLTVLPMAESIPQYASQWGRFAGDHSGIHADPVEARRTGGRARSSRTGP